VERETSPTAGQRHDPAAAPTCRACGAALTLTFVDLGMSPLCESFVPAELLEAPEVFYPLHVRVCETCFLVQLPALVPPEDIFGEYAYFSSYSSSWVEHARRYTEAITDRLGLGPESFVVEVASNDGYLLQHFVGAGIRVLGIDPAANVVEAAAGRGVPTVVDFLGQDVGRAVAAEHGPADLVVANNVLAHVPDVNDFVAGVAALLAPSGTVTFEFPHLRRLLEGVQYDTIYHEHFSYLSLGTVAGLLAGHGLTVTDVEELPTHGGSLRVHAMPADEAAAPSDAVARVLRDEDAAGLRDPETFARFAAAVEESKRSLLETLIACRRDGARVCGYGAPGKGNTLLNYCGIRTDLVEFTVDRNPYKHGRYTPGTHIPILPPEAIAAARPDVILVLPWNLFDEIAAQLAYTADWGARLLVPIPRARLVDAGARSG
jgi:SAM-dependent methyltransferase